MPYNPDGTLSRVAGTRIPSNGLILSPQVNDEIDDLISAADQKLGRDGKLAATGNLNLGSNKITNQADGVAATDSGTLSQIQSGVVKSAIATSGSVDAITCTLSPPTLTWRLDETFATKSTGPNTIVNPTLNKDGVSALTCVKGANLPLAIGDTGAAGTINQWQYNGTNLVLLNPATHNASTSTANTFTQPQTFSNSIIMAAGPICTPGGRLTLTSNTPVMTSDVAGATTVYYTPYLHNFAMLFNGSGWVTKGFSELSQTLADTTKSPAATVASNAYDVFLWDDAGTLRATRGPSWLVGGGSLTSRGVGSGSTAIGRVNGAMTNSFDILNGPLAGKGLYLGSFVTSTTNTVQWVANPAAAAGGGNCQLSLWNMYNRIEIGATSKDSTASWTYTTAAWRATNASNSNRITVFSGLNENIYKIKVMTTFQFSNGGSSAGIGLDSTTIPSGFQVNNFTGGGVDTLAPSIGEYNTFVGLGSHFAQWIEYGGSSGIGYGTNTASGRGQITSGLTLTGMM